MRFLRTGTPPVSRVLLVESGSRHLIEGVIPHLRNMLGEGTSFDLVTCYAGLPAGLSAESAVYPVHLYRGRQGPQRLCPDSSSPPAR